MTKTLQLQSAKRTKKEREGLHAWHSYYAGYSEKFEVLLLEDNQYLRELRINTMGALVIRNNRIIAESYCRLSLQSTLARSVFIAGWIEKSRLSALGDGEKDLFFDEYS